MFIVDTSYDYAEFNTYREAEIYCGENGISCENIYEEIWKSRKAFSFLQEPNICSPWESGRPQTLAS